MAEHDVNLDLFHVAERQHAATKTGTFTKAKQLSNHIRVSRFDWRQHIATFDAISHRDSDTVENGLV